MTVRPRRERCLAKSARGLERRIFLILYIYCGNTPIICRYLLRSSFLLQIHPSVKRRLSVLLGKWLKPIDSGLRLGDKGQKIEPDFPIWETGPRWWGLVCVFIFSTEGRVRFRVSLTKGSLRRCTSCPREVLPAGLYSFYRETDNEQRRTKGWPDKCTKWTDPEPRWALTGKLSFSRTAFRCPLVCGLAPQLRGVPGLFLTGRTKHSTGLPLKYSGGMRKDLSSAQSLKEELRRTVGEERSLQLLLFSSHPWSEACSYLPLKQGQESSRTGHMDDNASIKT